MSNEKSIEKTLKKSQKNIDREKKAGISFKG